MKTKQNLQTAQETSFDVSWAFFWVLPFSFPPREQLLAAVVLGPRGGCISRRVGFVGFREGGDGGGVDGGGGLVMSWHC